MPQRCLKRIPLSSHSRTRRCSLLKTHCSQYFNNNGWRETQLLPCDWFRYPGLRHIVLFETYKTSCSHRQVPPLSTTFPRSFLNSVVTVMMLISGYGLHSLRPQCACHDNISAVSSRISAVVLFAFAGSFKTSCHVGPWCGSAAVHRSLTAFCCSAVPCCFSNLNIHAQVSPKSGLIVTAFSNQFRALARFRSCQNMRATQTTTLGSLLDRFRASADLVFRAARSSIQIHSDHRSPDDGHSCSAASRVSSISQKRLRAPSCSPLDMTAFAC